MTKEEALAIYRASKGYRNLTDFPPWPEGVPEVSGVRMPKPVITNLGHGKYTYRGFAIHREDDQKGRWGYWRAKKDDELLLAATQGALLRQIDAHLVANSPCESA